jgi:large subunit ribosomal protein L29
MKAKEIKELSLEELEKKLRDARAIQLDQRLRKQVGQLEKTHELKQTRREIARFETILSSKKTAAKAS